MKVYYASDTHAKICKLKLQLKTPKREFNLYPSLSNLDHSKPCILGTPSTTQHPLWYPDTGATHHITLDNSIFSTKTAYTGNDFVQLGNGSGMMIRDFGSVILSTPHSFQLFELHNLYMGLLLIKML